MNRYGEVGFANCKYMPVEVICYMAWIDIYKSIISIQKGNFMLAS